jgi:uncharacterized membrane protein YfcA
MTIEFLLSTDMMFMVAAFIGSGIIRGFNGGVGANFITAPVLAAILGPRDAVPIVLMLNFITNAQIVPPIIHHVVWREIMPIALMAAVTVPLGAWALFAVDEGLMRRIVAGAAAVFAVILLTGYRYHGKRGVGVSLAAGGLAGILTGAVSMGGPPVSLYLMSGPDSVAKNRAQFVMFSGIVQISAFVVFVGVGAFNERMLWLMAIFLIPFSIATWVGTKLFHVASEEVFRRVTLWAMVAVSLAIVIF